MGQEFSNDDKYDEDTEFIKRYQENPNKMMRDLDLNKAESIRKRIMSDHHMLEKLPKQITINYKAIFVEYDKDIRVEIIFMENEEDLTVGWLMSETLRKVNEYMEKNNIVRERHSMVALKTKEKLYALDYWLSNLERPVSILKDRMTLVPFFADEKYVVGSEKITIDYFVILKLIGEGGFSKVYMARRKDTGEFYAIKMISKSEMIKRGKQDAIFKERDLMTLMEHPYIVKLHFAFQSDEYLFLVLDFLPGGELFYHIQKRRLFSEQQAKVYAGEIILGLNYLHNNKIIYRDLKPENILVDMDGHLHLADFGLCKKVRSKDDLNYSFCGSPEYLAPEVITKTGYNYLVDYYALGVLVYELVVGAPPFIRTANSDLYTKILTRDVYLPGHLSPKCKDFLSGLLEKDPRDRLGAKNGMSEIVNHPWIRDLNYGEIILKKVKVPLKPDPYNLNFNEEFINVRTTHCDINAEIQKSSSGMVGPTRQRFVNFSFYSNISEPRGKYVDPLFEGLQELQESQPKFQDKNQKLLMQSPEPDNRVRKLFESKGLFSSQRDSVISTNTGGNLSSGSLNFKGPRISMDSSGLRSEIFTTGNEEEKADLDINTNCHIDKANINRLSQQLVSPKPNSYHGKGSNYFTFDLGLGQKTHSDGMRNTIGTPSRQSNPTTFTEIATKHRPVVIDRISSPQPHIFKHFDSLPMNPSTFKTTENQRYNDLLNINPEPTNFDPISKVRGGLPEDTKKRHIQRLVLEKDSSVPLEDTEEVTPDEVPVISKAHYYQNDLRVSLNGLNTLQNAKTMSGYERNNGFRHSLIPVSSYTSNSTHDQSKFSQWMNVSKANTNSTTDSQGGKPPIHRASNSECAFSTQKNFNGLKMARNDSSGMYDPKLNNRK